jgi:hypothetical protein
LAGRLVRFARSVNRRWTGLPDSQRESVVRYFGAAGIGGRRGWKGAPAGWRSDRKCTQKCTQIWFLAIFLG